MAGPRNLRLIRQPEGSSLCGQCCLAMAAGVPLETALRAIGHRRASGTTTADLVAGLARLGISSQSRCRRISRATPAYPPRSLLVVRNGTGKRYHWMLHWDGIIYDPSGRWPDYEGWRITSYLEIHR